MHALGQVGVVHRVGRPTPRLTTSPSFSSLATRLGNVSPSSILLIHYAFCTIHDVVNQNAGGDDILGQDLTDSQRHCSASTMTYVGSGGHVGMSKLRTGTLVPDVAHLVHLGALDDGPVSA